MLIGTHDKSPEPGLYTAVIQDAVYYPPGIYDNRDLPGCVRLTMALTDAAGQTARFVDRIYLRESILWRLHQLHDALGLTEPMEIEKFISILPGLHVGVQVTRAGEYTRVRFVPAKAVPAKAVPSRAEPEEDAPDEPLPF